jgi:hypothetical protein
VAGRDLHHGGFRGESQDESEKGERGVMKLWVRSQERDRLEICNSLSIQPIIRAKKVSSWGIISNFGCVAEYATRERCLEILDEIQELFMRSLVTLRNVSSPNPSVEYHEQSVVVYEMPKE